MLLILSVVQFEFSVGVKYIQVYVVIGKILLLMDQLAQGIGHDLEGSLIYCSQRTLD